MTVLGRYNRPLADSAVFDGPLNDWPGVDEDVFLRANMSIRDAVADLAATASGVAIGTRIYLRRGDVVSSLTFVSGGTAAATPTNQIAALYSADDALLAQSADKLTEAWAADVAKTFTLAAPVTIPRDGWYVGALAVAAATVPTLAGTAARVGAQNAIPGAKVLTRTFGAAITGTAPAAIVTPTTVAKVPLLIVR
jgi:hypothetical protein